MQGTQYATKRSILCRGAFCGPTKLATCKLAMFKLVSVAVAEQTGLSMTWSKKPKTDVLVTRPIYSRETTETAHRILVRIAYAQ